MHKTFFVILHIELEFALEIEDTVLVLLPVVFPPNCNSHYIKYSADQMESYIIEDKVLEAQRMQLGIHNASVKYLKKYDIRSQTRYTKRQKSLIIDLHQPQYRAQSMQQQRDHSKSKDATKKVRNLLSNISNTLEEHSQPHSMKFFQINDYKKFSNKNTTTYQQGNRGILISRRQKTHHRQYSANYSQTWRRSPNCIIMPTKQISMRRQSETAETLNKSCDKSCENHRKCKVRPEQEENNLSIKERVDMEVEKAKIQKRINSRKSAHRKIKRVYNDKFTVEHAEEIERAHQEARMCQKNSKFNKANLMEVDLITFKPYSNGEMNKKTGRILKKYNFDSLINIRKFQLPE